MSQYSSNGYSNDVTTYKWTERGSDNLGVFGSLSAGEIKEFTSSVNFSVAPDFRQIIFQDSFLHNGEWRDILAGRTLIYEQTISPSTPLVGSLRAEVDGTTMTFSCRVQNPYGGSILLESTVLTFRYIGYTDTL